MLNKSFLQLINQRVIEFQPPYLAFGIFGLVNYPSFYIVWRYLSPQQTTSITLRMIATILCLPLIVTKFWPSNCKKYLPSYWLITITYCLPFFGTYLFLRNHGSQAWILNGMLVLFLLILITDWLIFFITLILGIIIGVVIYGIFHNEIFIIQKNASGVFSTYIWAIVIGMIFSRNIQKNKEALKERLIAIKILGASIAHELRTPLSSILLGAAAVGKDWHTIISGYKNSIKHKLIKKPISEKRVDKMAEVVADIHTEASAASAFIDILLMNVRQFQAKSIKLTKCSIKQCVDKALERYPFQPYQLKLIRYNSENDFLFKSDETLIIHVLFNLLKNGLYYVAEKGEGEIYIRFEQDERVNKLIFKDTGQGIKKRNLPNIFNEFYSKTPHGAGIGLAFCKMVMQNSGGDISCDSVFGEYTKFTLSFPKYE